MAATISIAVHESVFDIGRRLTALIEEAEHEAGGDQLSESFRERLANALEALRLHVIRKSDRDPRSLFELDERLIDLMDCAEEAAETGDIPQDLLQEIDDYLEAFRAKVDRISGYWRWQEFIVDICGKEVERLSARKKAAEGRVNRLKNMLLALMMSRGLKKLEGEKSSIGMQPNGMASLVIDDPVQIGECFFENHVRLTKTELQELVYQLADGELRRRLEAQLKGDGWEVNSSAVRVTIVNGSPVTGAARQGPPRAAPVAKEVKEAETAFPAIIKGVKTVPIPRLRNQKPKEDPYYPAGVKRAKEAVRRLQEAGIIDAKGRRIRQDLPPDMQEGQDRDFGG